MAKNYLPFARVLAHSLRRYHPDARLVLALADEVDGQFEPEAEPFTVLTPSELGVPALRDLAFRATQLEFAVALKPYLLAKLLENAESALFLDADLLVLDDLGSLFERVRGHAVTLVPHSLEPPVMPDRIQRELVLNWSGVFNGGVVGVARSDATAGFLNWWQKRLHTRCTHDVEHGMHYDQRWLDLVPGFVEDLHVHRDPGVDVAHWNLPERPLRVRNGTVTAAGVPCRLFHFSGFSPDDPETPTRYRPELRLEDFGEAQQLFRGYVRDLHDAGWREARVLRYAYGSFNNGVPIPDAARRLYAQLSDTRRFGDPFEATAKHSYFHWLSESPLRWRGSRGPSRLWLFIHGMRPDLQRALPHPLGISRRRFLRWARTHGAREHGVPPELLN